MQIVRQFRFLLLLLSIMVHLCKKKQCFAMCKMNGHAVDILHQPPFTVSIARIRNAQCSYRLYTHNS